MAKTVISAFRSAEAAEQVLNSAISGGFDSSLFSVIEPEPATAPASNAAAPDFVLRELTSIGARLYKKDLRMGDFLLIARVSERDVAPLIKLLQSIGGRHIEAFDPVRTGSE